MVKKMNMFEKATKQKIRFNYKGSISAEDLYDLDVTALDSIFKELNAVKKQSSEDSLLAEKTTGKTLLDTQIEIITYVVKTKLEERDARLLYADKQAKKQRIMEIIAKKQDGALEEKSLEDLQKDLDDL